MGFVVKLSSASARRSPEDASTAPGEHTAFAFLLLDFNTRSVLQEKYRASTSSRDMRVHLAAWKAIEFIALSFRSSSRSQWCFFTFRWSMRLCTVVRGMFLSRSVKT
ncbi:hypothetical protein INR49_032931 [Caranx melampygus]|nr:hypothetical protein INR49_032931 [Caranx melampygus]